MTQPIENAADPGDVIDLVLQVLLVAAVLRAAHPTPAAMGLAGAALEMAEALMAPPAGAMLTRIERYDAVCRQRLERNESLDPTVIAHLCAMGDISDEDPRHQEFLIRLRSAPDVLQRMEQVCSGRV